MANKSGPRGRRGTATIDFALTMALGFLPLTMGSMEFAWYFFQDIQTQSACREAIRRGASIPLDESPDVAIEGIVVDLLAASGVRGEAKASATIEGEPPMRTLHLELVVEHAPLLGLIPVPTTTGGRWTGRLEDQR